MANLTTAQLTALVRKHFGDLGEDVVQLMVRIAEAENASRDVGAIGDNFKSGHQTEDSPARYDYGPFQINSQHGFDPKLLTSDADYNVAAARQIYDRQGPQAWATYNAGLAGEAPANARPAPMRQTQQPQQGRRPPVPGATLVWSPDMARGGGGGPPPALSAVQGEFGGGPITQGFGPTSETLDGPYTDPDTGKTYKHFNKGVDIAMPSGAPVTAFNGGTVVTAGDDGTGWGTRVVVRDGNGFYHSYGHMNTTIVKPGEKVNTGGVLGASGNTGSSTGPHLSYDIYTADGRYYDPAKIAAAAAGGDEMAEPKGWIRRDRYGRPVGGRVQAVPSQTTNPWGGLNEPGAGGGDAPETVTDDAGNRYGWNANAINPDTGEKGDWVLLFPAQAEQPKLTSEVNPATGTMFVIEEDGTQWDTGVSWAEADRVQIPGKGLYERSPETGAYTLVIPEGGDYRPTDMPGVVFDGSTGQYLAPGAGGGLVPLTLAEIEDIQRRQMGLPIEAEHQRARQVLEGQVRGTARGVPTQATRGGGGGGPEGLPGIGATEAAVMNEAEAGGYGATSDIYKGPGSLFRGSSLSRWPLPGLQPSHVAAMQAAAGAGLAASQGVAPPILATMLRYNTDGTLDINDSGTRMVISTFAAGGDPALANLDNNTRAAIEAGIAQTGIQRFYTEGPGGTSAGLLEPAALAARAGEMGQTSGFIRNPAGAADERPFSTLDELKGLLGIAPAPTTPEGQAAAAWQAGNGAAPPAWIPGGYPQPAAAGGPRRTDVMAPEAPGAGMAAAPPIDPYANPFAGGRAAAADPYANVFAGRRAPAPVLPGITPAPPPIDAKDAWAAAKRNPLDDALARVLGLV